MQFDIKDLKDDLNLKGAEQSRPFPTAFITCIIKLLSLKIFILMYCMGKHCLPILVLSRVS